MVSHSRPFSRGGKLQRSWHICSWYTLCSIEEQPKQPHSINTWHLLCETVPMLCCFFPEGTFLFHRSVSISIKVTLCSFLLETNKSGVYFLCSSPKCQIHWRHFLLEHSQSKRVSTSIASVALFFFAAFTSTLICFFERYRHQLYNCTLDGLLEIHFNDYITFRTNPLTFVALEIFGTWQQY